MSVALSFHLSQSQSAFGPGLKLLSERSLRGLRTNRCTSTVARARPSPTNSGCNLVELPTSWARSLRRMALLSQCSCLLTTLSLAGDTSRATSGARGVTVNVTPEAPPMTENKPEVLLDVVFAWGGLSVRVERCRLTKKLQWSYVALFCVFASDLVHCTYLLRKPSSTRCFKTVLGAAVARILVSNNARWMRGVALFGTCVRARCFCSALKRHTVNASLQAAAFRDKPTAVTKCSNHVALTVVL